MANLQIATITRAQDYTPIKHNEDNRGIVQQTVLGQEMKKEVEHRTREVHKSDDSDWQNKKFDAKEKGSNEYSGNGGGRRLKKKVQEQVVVKGHSGFDMKI